MSTGNLPESLSQAILVGLILVGRLGVMSAMQRNAKLGTSIALTVIDAVFTYADTYFK